MPGACERSHLGGDDSVHGAIHGLVLVIRLCQHHVDDKVATTEEHQIGVSGLLRDDLNSKVLLSHGVGQARECPGQEVDVRGQPGGQPVSVGGQGADEDGGDPNLRLPLPELSGGRVRGLAP